MVRSLKHEHLHIRAPSRNEARSDSEYRLEVETLELVCSLAKLRSAGDIIFMNRPDHRFHLKILQEIIRTHVPLMEFTAARFGLIILNPFLVLLVHRESVEETARRQNPRQFVYFSRNLNYGNFRELGANQLTFGRVVVHKHHRIRGQIKLQGEVLDVCRLVFPVDAIAGDFVPVKQAVGVAVQHLPHGGFVVLAAEANQETFFGDGENLGLKPIVGDSGIFIGIQFNIFQTRSHR